MTGLLELTERGLYCRPGDFFIDPWRPVPRAAITHAHSDHARPGSAAYLTADPGVAVLRHRLGDDATIEGLPYGANFVHNGVRLSFHPAGHVLGAAQVRIEHRGQVCVVSGDYKTAPDPTCAPFEPLRCHTFVTESTFGLPIYRWRPSAEIFADINAWWRSNQQQNRTSVLFAYSLGKAQRILASIDRSIGPILLHGAIESIVQIFRQAGLDLPPPVRATTENARDTRGQALVLAPPSSENTPWLQKFGEVSTAVASGWMAIRGTRRRRAVDRGFALSDHADWDGLLDSIAATGAERVLVTHGYAATLSRWLNEHGTSAAELPTRFIGETSSTGEPSHSEAPEEDSAQKDAPQG